MRHALLILCSSLCALAAAQSPNGGHDDAWIVSNVGTYRVRYEVVDAAQVPMNELFDLRVTVHGAVDDADFVSAELELAFDAAMPEHGHGMVRLPSVERVAEADEASADAVFLVRNVLLHMPGRWELYFDVARRGMVERAQVELHLE